VYYLQQKSILTRPNYSSLFIWSWSCAQIYLLAPNIKINKKIAMIFRVEKNYHIYFSVTLIPKNFAPILNDKICSQLPLYAR